MRMVFVGGMTALSLGLAFPAVAQSVGGTVAAAGQSANVGGAKHLSERAINRASVPARHDWSERRNGRWVGGWNAPGGWEAYRRPAYGTPLPRYWMQPNFYIVYPQYYGLPVAPQGYGWSRYYDDAVMTDRYGRVIDYRGGYDWDRYEDGYGDRSDRRRGGDRAAGAVIGGVVGGVAGNVIAGRGNRTAGTIIGAGVGAIAGSAIAGGKEKSRDRQRHDAPRLDYRDDVTAQDYEGRWVGTWYGDDGRVYSGEYDGRYVGDVAGSYDNQPHWAGDEEYAYRERDERGDYRAERGYRPAPMPQPGYGYGYGYPQGGYAYGSGYYMAPGVTTVVIQPAMTTTTYVTEEVTYETVAAPVRRAAKRVVRAKPRVAAKPRCVCK